MSQAIVAVGQRYVSDTEPELGLGVVLEVDGGRAAIGFPAAEQRRTYAIDGAPISRVRYQVGESIKRQAGPKFIIIDIVELQGCVLYVAQNEAGDVENIPEFELDSFVQFSRPRERLFSGQIDKYQHFTLRYQTQATFSQKHQSSVFGLCGPRVSLLPHQMYIASQVAKRHEPRVLLADEVGLGKTIEAGLILHQQLMTGRTHRALIVVPESLLHQWLVEMLRRFNLSFTLLDEARCLALTDDSDELDNELFDDILEKSDDEMVAALDELTEKKEASNPFDSSQLILCSLDFLTQNPNRLDQALACEWDMLLVDEAHHLTWSPKGASVEYQCIEKLSKMARGLLLLTATPEQLGFESHFARLSLLDPDRYYSFDAFVEEQQQYQPLNELVQALLALRPEVNEAAPITGDISTELKAQLTGYLSEKTLADICDYAVSVSLAQAIDDAVTLLLDRHGTGRVILRNTRHSVAGFPERHLELHYLPVDDEAAIALASTDVTTQLHPEHYWQTMGDWWLHDPRILWLKTLLKSLKGKKVLVICAETDTAQALELHLRLRQGIASAVFHEEMNLIARDRAAAYFSDPEDGAQVLVASEIGSEGRNFQFAQHLVLFDLPANPDLLEQRIGRLDRIGQGSDIYIHLPLYESESADNNSASHKLARWYHEGLNAFESTCAIGHATYSHFKEKLSIVLSTQNDAALTALVTETRSFADKLNVQLQAGRDRLLELNACRPVEAQAIIKALEDQDSDESLPNYLMSLLDSFGVDYERDTETSWILHPGDHMRVDPFPGLPQAGMTATFSREQALTREDMHFLTWEHPMVHGAQELILHSEFGNTALATLKLPGIKPGTLLVEAVYILYCSAPPALQLDRYLSQAMIRVLLDDNGKDYSKVLNVTQMGKLLKKVGRASAQELVRHGRTAIASLLDLADVKVEPLRDEKVTTAVSAMQHDFHQEISRLKELAIVNPNVRPAELEHLEAQCESCERYLSGASLKLDAVRVIMAV